ncbi:MAG TPA: zeta toxin family protein [Candidatus Binataceae bacterium]|nr:zeta toxin family protein [Candidatus Binataceae bacterium]
MPWFILIAGPNGAGKTTLATDRDFQNWLIHLAGRPLRHLNPDEIANNYYNSNPGVTLAEANYWAANAVPEHAIRCIDAGESIAVETVLSSGKYERIISRAHAAGHQVGMIYLAVESAKVLKKRVANRYEAGGHTVPDEKIKDRWKRSLDWLVKFAPAMDGLFVFDSTSSGLKLLAQKNQGTIIWHGSAKFPKLKARLGAQDPR